MIIEKTPFQVVVEKVDAESGTTYKKYYNVVNENNQFNLTDEGGYVAYCIKSLAPQHLFGSEYLIQILYHDYDVTHQYV